MGFLINIVRDARARGMYRGHGSDDGPLLHSEPSHTSTEQITNPPLSGTDHDSLQRYSRQTVGGSNLTTASARESSGVESTQSTNVTAGSGILVESGGSAALAEDKATDETPEQLPADKPIVANPYVGSMVTASEASAKEEIEDAGFPVRNAHAHDRYSAEAYRESTGELASVPTEAMVYSGKNAFSNSPQTAAEYAGNKPSSHNNNQVGIDNLHEAGTATLSNGPLNSNSQADTWTGNIKPEVESDAMQTASGNESMTTQHLTDKVTTVDKQMAQSVFDTTVADRLDFLHDHLENHAPVMTTPLDISSQTAPSRPTGTKADSSSSNTHTEQAQSVVFQTEPDSTDLPNVGPTTIKETTQQLAGGRSYPEVTYKPQVRVNSINGQINVSTSHPVVAQQSLIRDAGPQLDERQQLQANISGAYVVDDKRSSKSHPVVRQRTVSTTPSPVVDASTGIAEPAIGGEGEQSQRTGNTAVSARNKAETQTIAENTRSAVTQNAPRSRNANMISRQHSSKEFSATMSSITATLSPSSRTLIKKKPTADKDGSSITAPIVPMEQMEAVSARSDKKTIAPSLESRATLPIEGQVREEPQAGTHRQIGNTTSARTTNVPPVANWTGARPRRPVPVPEKVAPKLEIGQITIVVEESDAAGPPQRQPRDKVQHDFASLHCLRRL